MNRLALFVLLIASIAKGQTEYNPLRSISVNQPYLIDAVEMLRYGNPEGAVKYIRNAPEETARSFEAEYLLGTAYRIQGKITEAIEAFSRASRYESMSLPAHFERGNCYLIKKTFNLAVFDYDRVLLLDSTFVPAYNNRAYARIRNYGENGMPLQQLRFARQDMEMALKYSSKDAVQGFEYYFNLGLLDLYLSEYEKAIASFNQAMLVEDGLAKLYYYRGAAYFLARFYDKARDDFESAESLGFVSEQTPEFLNVLGLIKKHEEETGNQLGKK
jgi:tetratricopeptide (TPR) repeat protein